MAFEIGVLQALGAFVGHSTNCQTTAAADQEDGAPHRGEREAKGGGEAYGENIQRAQRERDLAESNMRDLEYQKGVLYEQLAMASKQLQGKFE